MELRLRPRHHRPSPEQASQTLAATSRTSVRQEGLPRLTAVSGALVGHEHGAHLYPSWCNSTGTSTALQARCTRPTRLEMCRWTVVWFAESWHIDTVCGWWPFLEKARLGLHLFRGPGPPTGGIQPASTSPLHRLGPPRRRTPTPCSQPHNRSAEADSGLGPRATPPSRPQVTFHPPEARWGDEHWSLRTIQSSAENWRRLFMRSRRYDSVPH